MATPQRVRERAGLDPAELPDAAVERFIAGQEAVLAAALGRRPLPGDEDFALACSVVADLAAAQALVALAGGANRGLDYRIGKLDVRRRGQLDGRLAAIAELKERAATGLALLQRRSRARRFVLINGGE